MTLDAAGNLTIPGGITAASFTGPGSSGVSGKVQGGLYTPTAGATVPAGGSAYISTTTFPAAFTSVNAVTLTFQIVGGTVLPIIATVTGVTNTGFAMNLVNPSASAVTLTASNYAVHWIAQGT